MNKHSGRNVKAGRSRNRAEELKSLLSGRETELLRWHGIPWPPAKRAQHINCSFPGHDDKNPSWRWDGKKEAWFCSCGGGDILSAVQRMMGIQFLEASDIVERDFLNLTGTQPAKPRSDEPQQTQIRLDCPARPPIPGTAAGRCA